MPIQGKDARQECLMKVNLHLDTIEHLETIEVDVIQASCVGSLLKHQKSSLQTHLPAPRSFKHSPRLS